MKELIALNERSIRKALEDYTRHTSTYGGLECVSDDFVHNLAEDNAYSKAELRELFRKSPAWNEELQALVINGNRTHEPNWETLLRLLENLLTLDIKDHSHFGYQDRIALASAICHVAKSNYLNQLIRRLSIMRINEVDPNAYKPGKKPSRILRDVCKALNITDERSGSEFQKLYAKCADEMSSKKIDYKLFVSINPAHFLTMSNPAFDNRGDTLISCHSLNSGSYRSGCIGYARDKYSIIAFTASDPDDPETLNNRKTTRQMYAYKPGNGALLQSRMYNTRGGADGERELSREYRRLIEKEVSECEGVPNLWKASPSANSDLFAADPFFTGYVDFIYSCHNGVVAVRENVDSPEKLDVGEIPLCIRCGEEFCSHEGGSLSCCGSDMFQCELCGTLVHMDYVCLLPDDTPVCEDCYDEQCFFCIHCQKSYFRNDEIEIDGESYCEDCAKEIAFQCEICGEWERDENAYHVSDERTVCEDCFADFYTVCDECDAYCVKSKAVYIEDGVFCPGCANEVATQCDICKEWVWNEDVIEITDYDGQTLQVCKKCYKRRLQKALVLNDCLLEQERAVRRLYEPLVLNLMA